MNKVTNVLLLAIAAFLFLACMELRSIDQHLEKLSISAASIDNELDSLKFIESDLSH